MRDIDDRLGEVIAAVVRAGRTLAPDHLEELLKNIDVEVGAALMQEEARRRRSRVKPSATVFSFPRATNQASGAMPTTAEEKP